jgi:hypothetical protein
MSSCLHLQVNLKKKLNLYVNSTTQRCLNKIIETFLIKDFFPFATGTYWWCTLSCEYLRKFSKKSETALMGYSGAWENLIHETQ